MPLTFVSGNCPSLLVTLCSFKAENVQNKSNLSFKNKFLTIQYSVTSDCIAKSIIFYNYH